jgi:hypothetical protein
MLHAAGECRTQSQCVVAAEETVAEKVGAASAVLEAMRPAGHSGSRRSRLMAVP